MEEEIGKIGVKKEDAYDQARWREGNGYEVNPVTSFHGDHTG